MHERILQAVAAHGDRAVVVPVGRLADLRRDVEALRRDNVLNGLQQQIVDGTYHLEVPDLGFPMRSIVLVATPSADRRRAGISAVGDRGDAHRERPCGRQG